MSTRKKLAAAALLAALLGGSTVAQASVEHSDTHISSTDTVGLAVEKSESLEEMAVSETPVEAAKTDALEEDDKVGPTPTVGDLDWRAETAAVSKMAKLFEVALEVKQAEADKQNLDLNAVGRSYTANSIEALKTTDFVVGPFQLSKPISEEAIGEDMMSFYKSLGGGKTGSVNGMFTTYTGDNGAYTVYSGPVQGQDRQLRSEGLDYDLPVGAVTNIHITGGDFETDRDISIGKSRGAVLFAYGSPQAAWRDTTEKSIVLVYALANEKKENYKKDFTATVANLGNKTVLNERLKETDQSSGYILFTLVDNKVKAIDLIDGQVRAKLPLPSTDLNHFKANELSPRDFVLMGYEVNKPFVTNQNDSWQQRGLIYGSDFLSYDDILIGYDQDHLISRAMITKSTAITRRGISIGDSKYLLLYLYGVPTTIESDVAKNGDALQVYTYANPISTHSYLIFVIGEKDNFIKSVMLSDRPRKELEL